MNIIPAIDLQSGRCVRLTQGDFGQQKIYDVDPVAIAKRYESEGAHYLHIVDLDGAKEGQPMNVHVIQNIRQAVSMFIEVGGGIRTIETAAMYLSMGIDRVIIGTSAIEDEKMLASLINQYHDRIAVGLDVDRQHVMVRGWMKDTKVHLDTVLSKLETIGVETIICTDIQKDGMLEGTNLELYRQLKEKTKMNIIASGGVTSMNEIKELRALNLEGAIIGKALYENRLILKEVIAC
jgi:phosphoribosylformimino-5-aminoimidazole carboxamide ribotide isomerase